MRTLSALLLVAVAGPALAQKEFGFDNRKGSGQPYLTPDETVKRFKVAPEFEVKLFAGEPQVVNPIAFTIDERGRVWLIESFEYPKRTPKGAAPRDRIVILEDTDGDGVADKRTVFAEGKDFPVPEERKKAGLGAFDMASGIEVGHGGVFVGAPPYLWFLSNKDDKPGKVDVLLKGFGSEDTHETLNTFQWGPDGWLYGLHGIYTNSTVKPASPPGNGGESPDGIKMNAAVWRYHPKTKKFEIFAEGTSNPWGLDWRNTDGQFIAACCVIPHLFHIVPGGLYKRQAGASFNPYAYGLIPEICDHTFHRESGWAHAGLISLDVPHMPEKYRNSVIFGSIHGCSIKQNVLKPNGSSFTASRADDFLQSGDKNVRPINLRWGPQGDIYLIDWHDQNPCHQTKPDDWDYERGRVYRIQLKGTTPKKAEDLGKLTDLQLASAIVDDPNPYRNRTARRVLFDRQPETPKDFPKVENGIAAKALESAAAAVAFRGTVLLDTIRVFDPDFEHKLATVRAAYVRNSFLEDDEEVKELTDLARKESSPIVRRELASLAVRFAEKGKVLSVLHALIEHKEDAKDPLIPHLIWFAYEKAISKKTGASTPVAAELAWLKEHAAGNALVAEQIIPRTMRRLVATGQPDDLAACVKFASELADASAKRQALAGLAEGLKGQTVKPPAGWAEARAALEKDADPAVRDAVTKIGVVFRDPAAVKRALAVVNDSKQPADARAEAVRQLAALKATEAVAIFPKLLTVDPDATVRIEAARGLAAFSDAKLADTVLAGWAGYAPPVRAELVNTLAGRKEWAKQLLAAMEAKTVDRRDATDNTILRIQAFADPELNALVEKAWGRTRPTPKELDALIDKMRGELGAPGSFARGKLVFDNQCAKCHKFDGRGNEVGPLLDGAARDIEYILANVIDPNRVIGAPYFQRIAKTLDGRVEQGLLAEEDDQFITLKVENGVLKKLAKKDLDGPVTVVEKSMMPEGLAAGMSPQDFRDLVRYVMAHPFIIAATVNGQPAAAGVTGRFALPDGGGKDSVLEAEVTATDAVTTQLLVGSADPFEVKLDGKVVGAGQGTGGRAAPDREAVPVVLAKGTHTLAVVVKAKAGGQGLFVRFLDPDRKLHYPELGAGK